MKLKLLHKLLLAFLTGTTLVLVVVVMITRVQIGQDFIAFLGKQDESRLQQVAPALATWYERHGDWSALRDDPREFRSLVLSAAGDGSRWTGRGSGRPGSGFAATPGGGFGPPPGAGAGRINSLPQRIFLLDPNRQAILGARPDTLAEGELVPVTSGGQTLGWLGVAGPRAAELPEEEAFVSKLRQSLFVGLGLGLVMAILLAWLMARHLSRPVNVIAGGIHDLAAGDFGKQLDTRGTDEIAQLARDVNRLSSTLKENETVRNRWMSDISHELRTPLSIISGELEAMIDGVRPMDQEQLASVREEVQHLTGLIEDLRSLALTDSGALAYRMAPLDLAVLCQAVTQTFEGSASDKRLALDFEGPGTRCRVRGDEARLRQLLENLLDNAIRYTDTGGRVLVALVRENGQVVLRISDSPPGVDAEECERLFERLYRKDSSRSRHSGGSGLGLAICRNITQAHGGAIDAAPGPEGGLLVTVTLPAEDRTAP